MGSCTNIDLRKNTRVINFAQSRAQSQVRSIFRAPSQNFKILAIPNVLAHGSRTSMGLRKNATIKNFA
ncbi:hypothetical protein GW17_00061065 [Ensete ventricosum]|nr:hypothetical protein GW17_00061065 [Ensete ventricosum]